MPDFANQNNNETSPTSEPADLRSVFGTNLRELSQQATSIAQLCRDLGINRTQYNRYLTGDSFPRPDVLHKICTFFKVDARILLEPLEDLYKQKAEREGQSPISQAMRNSKLVHIDTGKLLPGPYILYRRSFENSEYVTAGLTCLFVDPRGAVGLKSILHRNRSDLLGLPVAGHKRRIDGMFFQHPTGVSFLTIVRNLPQLHLGFVEFAYLGNPRFFHGTSIVTQKFTVDSPLAEPVLLEQLDPTLSAMVQTRHFLGHTHIDHLNATAQKFFRDRMS